MSRKTFSPLLIVLALLAARLPAAETTDVDPAQLDAWIQQLDSDDFAARERAFQQLVKAGAPAIQAVADAVGSEHHEIAWRAARALERIGVAGDEETIRAVILAMERLDRSGVRSFAQTRSQMAQRWRKFRHRRASTEIARLGGEVVHMPGGLAFGGGFVPGGAPPAVFGVLGERVDFFVPGDVIEAIEPVEIDIAPIELAPAVKVEVIELEKVEKVIEVEIEEFKGRPVEEIDPAEIERAVDRLGERARERLERAAKEIEAALDEIEIKPVRPIEVERPELPKLPKPVIEKRPIEKPAIEVKPIEFEALEEGDEIIEIEEIEVVDEEAMEDAFDDLIEGGFIAPAVDFGAGAAVWDAAVVAQNSHMVRLGEKWKGGDEGLALLKDISHLSVLELNNFDVTDAVLKRAAELPQLHRLVVNRSRFDHEKLMQLKKLKPNLTVYATGKGLLGISGSSHPHGFQVNHVVPDSGADKAGIMPGDVIQVAGGRQIKSLDELTLLVSPMNVGDKLEVTLLRGETTKKLTAILGPREPQILE